MDSSFNLNNNSANNKEVEELDNVETYINQITMEYMTNTNYYKTYLEKNNPSKLKKMQEFQRKIQLYEQPIKLIFHDLIENYDSSTIHKNTQIYKSLENFLIHVIEHIEKTNMCKKHKEKNEYDIDSEIHGYNHEDNEQEDEHESNDDEDNEHEYNNEIYNPFFWGKKIKKI